jgi:hypothetical protein
MLILGKVASHTHTGIESNHSIVVISNYYLLSNRFSSNFRNILSNRHINIMRHQKSNKYRRNLHAKGLKPKAIYKRSRFVEILPSTITVPVKRTSEISDRKHTSTQREQLFKKHINRWKRNRLSKKSPKYPPALHFSPKARNSFGLLNFDVCSTCTDEDWAKSTDYFGSFSSVSQYDF